MKKLIIGVMVSGAFFLGSVVSSSAENHAMESIKNIPTKISTHIASEWEETKKFQAESWASAKEQNARNLAKFKKFLGLGD
jgi:hypothetical protein